MCFFYVSGGIYKFMLCLLESVCVLVLLDKIYLFFIFGKFDFWFFCGCEIKLFLVRFNYSVKEVIFKENF